MTRVTTVGFVLEGVLLIVGDVASFMSVKVVVCAVCWLRAVGSVVCILVVNISDNGVVKPQNTKSSSEPSGQSIISPSHIQVKSVIHTPSPHKNPVQEGTVVICTGDTDALGGTVVVCCALG